MLVPDTAQFVIEATGGPIREFNDILNIIHIRDTENPWTQLKIDATAERIYNSWADNITPLLNDDYYFHAVNGKDLGAVNGTVTSYQPAVPIQGAGTGEGAPYQLALLIKIRGDAGGMPRNGRLFISALNISDQEDQQWTAGTVTAFTTAFDAFLSDIDFGTEAFVLVSRFEPNPTPPPGSIEREEGVTNTISGFTVQRLYSSMSKRRYGVGS